MPKASDGKNFPYTKEGLVQLKAYNERLKKKPKTMGKEKNGNGESMLTANQKKLPEDLKKKIIAKKKESA
jgi:hypothetical protein|tara:strand:+ start:8358 stop:8567 length:210 start_codon:yes stop_codon:yes gene_type:complete